MGKQHDGFGAGLAGHTLFGAGVYCFMTFQRHPICANTVNTGQRWSLGLHSFSLDRGQWQQPCDHIDFLYSSHSPRMHSEGVPDAPANLIACAKRWLTITGCQANIEETPLWQGRHWRCLAVHFPECWTSQVWCPSPSEHKWVSFKSSRTYNQNSGMSLKVRSIFEEWTNHSLAHRKRARTQPDILPLTTGGPWWSADLLQKVAVGSASVHQLQQCLILTPWHKLRASISGRRRSSSSPQRHLRTSPHRTIRWALRSRWQKVVGRGQSIGANRTTGRTCDDLMDLLLNHLDHFIA